MTRPDLRGRRQYSRGFTLLEIMVVVLIIGILINFAVLSVGDRALADTLDDESRRVERLLVLAQEEAELQGLIIGLRITEDQLQWVGLTGNNRWMPYAESGALRIRPLTPPVELALNVEGRQVPPAQTLEDPEASMEPQALFLSSGEVTPLVLDVTAPPLDTIYRIEVDALGRVQRQQLRDDAQ